jgi:hypothetical protein
MLARGDGFSYGVPEKIIPFPGLNDLGHLACVIHHEWGFVSVPVIHAVHPFLIAR